MFMFRPFSLYVDAAWPATARWKSTKYSSPKFLMGRSGGSTFYLNNDTLTLAMFVRKYVHSHGPMTARQLVLSFRPDPKATAGPPVHSEMAKNALSLGSGPLDSRSPGIIISRHQMKRHIIPFLSFWSYFKSSRNPSVDPESNPLATVYSFNLEQPLITEHKETKILVLPTDDLPQPAPPPPPPEKGPILTKTTSEMSRKERRTIKTANRAKIKAFKNAQQLERRAKKLQRREMMHRMRSASKAK